MVQYNTYNNTLQCKIWTCDLCEIFYLELPRMQTRLSLEFFVLGLEDLCLPFPAVRLPRLRAL